MRLLARAVDALILFACVCVAIVIAAVLVGSLGDIEEGEVPDSVTYLLVVVVAITYEVSFPPLLGATPGKLLLGYKIVNEEGRQISFGQSIVRLIAQLPAQFVFGIPYLAITISRSRQGWHDQLARTYVVHKEFVRASWRM